MDNKLSKFIVDSFKDILKIDVRIVFDDFDVNIYKNDQYNDDISDKELLEYNPDYVLTKNRNMKCIYGVGYNIDPIIRNGEVLSPPDCDIKYSKIEHDLYESALVELIKTIVSYHIDDIYEDVYYNLEKEMENE